MAISGAGFITKYNSVKGDIRGLAGSYRYIQESHETTTTDHTTAITSAF